MLTLIDNHPVPYWSAIDGYLIAEARKGLLVNALETHGWYCARSSFCRDYDRKKKPKTFDDSRLRPKAWARVKKKQRHFVTRAYGQGLGTSKKYKHIL